MAIYALLVWGLILTLGAMHLFYDGLLWKLRRSEVARGFQIAQPNQDTRART